MKIAILGIKTYPALAGADRVVEEIVNRLPKDYIIYLYLSKIDNRNYLIDSENIKFIYIPSIKGKHIKPFVYFLLSAFHVLFFGKYDLINIHNSDFGLFNIIVSLKNKNIISTFHGSGYKRDKWNWIAKKFLVISEYFFIRFCKIITIVAENILTDIPIKFHYKVKYIPNGIDPKNLVIEENVFNYNELQIKKGDYFLFACGRLDKTKGLHHLIKAYLHSNFYENLLVIGDYTHDKKYSKEIERLASNSSKIILLRKLLPKTVLFDVLKNSKVFIFPSEIEAMSMILLEAISLKVPVICSDIPENISVVGKDYKYMFKNKDYIDLKRIIEQFILDEDKELIVESLFQRVSENFHWNKIVKDYLITFNKIYME